MEFNLGEIQKIRLRLERLKELPQLLNEELRHCANDVAQVAKDMAPIDYGDLKDAIQVGRRGVQGAGGRFVSGMSNYEVFINERHPVSDPDKIKHGVDHVGEYAWYVHEHMGWSGYDTGFMPSEKSVEAGLEKGVDAGGKFLERALEEMRVAIEARMASVNAKYVKTVDIQ